MRWRSSCRRPAAFQALIVYIALSAAVGCEDRESIGGRWQIVTTTGIPESGNREDTLYRTTSNGRRLVARLVGTWRYYGNDCLVYSTRANRVGIIEYFAACGDRVPLRVAEERYFEWELGPDRLTRRMPAAAGRAAETRELLLTEITARALAQPTAKAR